MKQAASSGMRWVSSLAFLYLLLESAADAAVAAREVDDEDENLPSSNITRRLRGFFVPFNNFFADNATPNKDSRTERMDNRYNGGGGSSGGGAGGESSTPAPRHDITGSPTASPFTCPDDFEFEGLYLIDGTTGERLRPIEQGHRIELSKYEGTRLAFEVALSATSPSVSIGFIYSDQSTSPPRSLNVLDSTSPYTFGDNSLLEGERAPTFRVEPRDWNPIILLYCTQLPASTSDFDELLAQLDFTVVENMSTLCGTTVPIMNIGDGFSLSGSTREALRLSDLSPALDCQPNFNRFTRAIFYQFAGDGNSYQVMVEVEGTNFDTVLAILEGPDCGLSECVATNDDARPSTTLSALSIMTEPGQSYWLVVGGFDGTVGEFMISFVDLINIALTNTPSELPASPVQSPTTGTEYPTFSGYPTFLGLDQCEQAEVVTIADGMTFSSNTEAIPDVVSPESPSVRCDTFSQVSRAFYIEVVGEEGIYNVAAESPSFSITFGVLEGTDCGSALCRVFSESDQIYIPFSLVSSTRYWVVVGSSDLFGAGDFTISFSRVTPQPTPIVVPTAPIPTPIGAPTADVKFEIVTDFFPEETTFVMEKDGDPNPVLQGGPFVEPSTGFSFSVSLPPGIYTLHVSDSGSDGLCCINGVGFFSLFLEGEVPYSIGRFGSFTEVRFSIGSNGEATLLTVPEVVEGLQPTCNAIIDNEFNICLYLQTRVIGATPIWINDFAAAAARWEEIIIEDDIDTYTPAPGITEFEIPEVIDDLYISGIMGTIDGPSGTLAFASPDIVETIVKDGVTYERAVTGSMAFDVDDLDSGLLRDTFVDTVIHEMAHVLGIGSLWEYNGLVLGGQYLGENANREYLAYGFTNPGTLPLENEGGDGSVGAHWAEACLEDEMMTSQDGPGLAALSRITIGGMEDLGFTVDYGVADYFSAKCRCGNTGPGCTRHNQRQLHRMERQSDNMDPLLLQRVHKVAARVYAERNTRLAGIQLPPGSKVYEGPIEFLVEDSDGHLHEVSISSNDV